MNSKRENLSINGEKILLNLHPISVIHRIERKLKGKKPSYTFFKDDTGKGWHSTLKCLDKEYTTKNPEIIQFNAQQKVAKSALDIILSNLTEEQLVELAKLDTSPIEHNDINQLITKSRKWWHRESTQGAKSSQRHLKKYCQFYELGVPKISSFIDERGMLIVLTKIKKRKFYHTSSTNLNREAAIEEAAKTAFLTLFSEQDNLEMTEIKKRMIDDGKE